MIESLAKSVGMRVGQLIWNAVDAKYGINFEDSFHKLFYIEDEELVGICKEYIKNILKKG